MTTQIDRLDDSNSHVVDSATLRRRAEERARAMEDQGLAALSPAEARRLLYELRVHQIELEMQDEELRRTQKELEQRVRELDCLHGISALIEQPGITLAGILQGSVRLLPPVWRSPQATGARILFEDQEFRSDDCRETEWRLSTDMIVNGRPAGRVEVYSSQPRSQGDDGPFRGEEHSLLTAVAQRLGRTIERMRAEERLHSQQQQLEVITDSIPAYIAYADTDLNLLHVNRALAEWWGSTKEQVVGRNFRQVAPPAESEHLTPYLRQVVASGQTVTHEFQTVGAAEQALVGQVNCVPHLDEQGNIQGLVVLTLDVTEQRQSELELRTQQQRLDLIIDNVPAYIVYTDAEWNILHANRAYAGFWGRSKEEIVGKTVKEVASPRAYQELAGYLQQVAASRQAVSWEGQVASAASQTYVMWRTYVPHLDEQGNVAGFVALIQDVTAQRQAEEALRASEERYRIVIENMHEGVGMVDAAGNLTYANDRLCEMVGRTRDELIGQSSAQLFFGQEQERHLDRLAQRRAGISDTYESVYVHRDGAHVPVLISASPMRDAEGKYKGSFAVMTDITAQKRAEQALLEAKEAAEAAQEAAELARLEEQKRRQESERRQRLAEGLADVLGALNAKRPLDDVLNLVVRQARQLLAGQAAAIYGLEGPDSALRVHATQGRIGALFSETSSLAIHAVLEEAIARRRPVASAELPAGAGRGPDVNRQTDLPSQTAGQESFLAAPILLADRAYGALVVYRAGRRLITAEDKELTALMAAQAALAVENTRLRAEAEEAAITAERTRLARELHDSVTQALFSASLISETLPRVWERYPQEGRRALDELHRLTHGALAEMRTLLLELRPAALQGQPLDTLIAQLADALPARTRMLVFTTTSGDLTTPEDIKLAVYRIAQEALNNVVKHAHASQVRISLRGEPDHVTLSVDDDGRGFDPSGGKPHQLGLGIMHERARAVGAQLSVESQLGQGTKITVSWSST